MSYEPLEARRLLALGDLLHTLNNPTPASQDEFGTSVAVSGNTVVVGAPSEDWTTLTSASAAYFFDAATGNLRRSLSRLNKRDRFGFSVAVSGSAAVVGATRDNTGASDTGAAYIFDAATGSQLRRRSNLAPTQYDDFGNSVAVSGNVVVVGAPYHNINADFRSPNWHDSLSPISAELAEFFRLSVMRLFARKLVCGNRWSFERPRLVPRLPWVFERFG